MVRLVFRPYTRLRRSICTSESLRTSTRVSPGFVLAGHRSPSFGSQHVRSGCACPGAGKPTPFANAPGMRRRDSRPRRRHQATDLPSASTKASLCFHCALVFGGTETRAHVRLLGPCFKTGRMEPQPNSSQTRARAAKQATAAGTCTRDARQGAQSTQTASHAKEQLPPTLLAETPRKRSIDRTGTRSKDNSRVANNGSPEGLETGRAPKNAPRPNLPTASTPKRTRSEQTGKHNPRAARKPIGQDPERLRRPTRGAVRAPALAHQRRPTATDSGNRSRGRPPHAPPPALV
jgi:hypothetical protein